MENQQQPEEKKDSRSVIGSADATKWIALLITILGIQAWIAGASFLSGYWGVAGLPGPFNPKSLQETALYGFIGAFKNWGVLGLVIFLLGPFFILIGFSLRRTKNAQLKKPSKFQIWFESKWVFDRNIGRFGAAFMMAGIIYVIGFLIPMALWSVASDIDGQVSFKRDVCTLRAGKAVIATIPLNGGSNVKGEIIDRTQTMTAVLQENAIQVVSAGEKQQLLYTITLPEIKCDTELTRRPASR